MFELKTYQQRAIRMLRGFLSRCRETGSIEGAFKETLFEQGMQEVAYRDHGFEGVPYVCFRIPTGGGKTVLASHAVSVAATEYLSTDFPIALWLVPTTTIRMQTVEALKKPDHPYRKALDEAFKNRVMVLDIDEVTQIRPHDLGSRSIVVVSTIANLRVSDTSGRKVYAYHENFEPHFSKVSSRHPALDRLERVSEGDLKENGLNASVLGNIKYSFANLLAIHRPLIIVDEAHNARTTLTFNTLRRVHPAAIVEFTATPNTTLTNGSNVLFHVSAAELRAQHMIKLPIVLTEHQNWYDSVRDAVITRNRLAIQAQKDSDYIRPIALFQAEAKNGEITVDVLRNHLIEDLKVPENKIAVVTGSQRELDDIDLFDENCPIEYIITIEALKEGWDCSFAYVFCSVKQVSSSKDAEQLLGRVLRMPKAERRVIEDLNKAYAHLATPGFSQAARQLTDKLVAMGFEEMEVASLLQEREAPAGQSDLFNPDELPLPPTVAPKDLIFELPSMPDFSHVENSERQKVTVSNSEDGSSRVRIEGEISPSVEEALSRVIGPQVERERLLRDIRIHNQRIEATKAPSERGAIFGSLPMLCAEVQGELELVEPETFLDSRNWNLLDFPAELKSFRITDRAVSFSIDIEGKKMSYQRVDSEEAFSFNDGFTDVTEQDLVRWLDRSLRQPDIMQNQLIKFIQLVVRGLLRQSDVSLTGLVRNKFPLSRAIHDLIARYRKQVQESGYQAELFGEKTAVRLSDQFTYNFAADYYPSRPPYYTGRYRFKKHYFPISQIEDLKGQGEEFDCAQVIDNLDQVEFWIRNLVRRDYASFWLPLATRRFYPDFVCRLSDGRMLVVEYKGDAYASNDDSAEKRAVGDLWARASEGACVFIMVVKRDGHGRDIREQIASALATAKS